MSCNSCYNLSSSAHFSWRSEKCPLHCSTVLVSWQPVSTVAKKVQSPVFHYNFVFFQQAVCGQNVPCFILFWDLCIWKDESTSEPYVTPFYNRTTTLLLAVRWGLLCYRESRGIIKRSLPCLVMASVDRYTGTFFSQGTGEWLRKSEETNLWRPPKPEVAMSFSSSRTKCFNKI